MYRNTLAAQGVGEGIKHETEQKQNKDANETDQQIEKKSISAEKLEPR